MSIRDISAGDESDCSSSFPQTELARLGPQTKEQGGDSLATADLYPAVKCRWSECGEWFSNLQELATHVSHTHAVPGGEGLFYCGWEGCLRTQRGFNARYKMLVHVRTHTNEKPHTCYECQKSFSRAENLKIHARSHTGEKPYLCPVSGCHKAYSNSSDRFKHTRTHSIDRPYTCKVPGCSKRYTDPSSLRKHAKTNSHFFIPHQSFLGKSSQKEGEKTSEESPTQDDGKSLKIECVTTHFSTSWLQSIYPDNTSLLWNRLDEQETPLDLTMQQTSYN